MVWQTYIVAQVASEAGAVSEIIFLLVKLYVMHSVSGTCGMICVALVEKGKNCKSHVNQICTLEMYE